MFIFVSCLLCRKSEIIMALDDSKVINDVVDRLKKQGLFDKFRKECMADVDTKVRFSSYQDLTSILPVWASPGIWLGPRGLGPRGHADSVSLVND